jgi:THO complex subunit 4
VAYVVYSDIRDARTAIQEFDGANANGQPIRLSLVPNVPNNNKSQRNPFDSIDRPARSLFDRVDESERRRRAGATDNDDEPNDQHQNQQQQQSRPRRSNVSRPAPDHIDRYIPGQGNDDVDRGPTSGRRPRSSPRRDNRGRGSRRPGQQRQGRDSDGHAIVQGRPRKTAEELDDEMTDYWNGQQGDGAAASEAPVKGEGKGNSVNPLDGDIDMDV